MSSPQPYTACTEQINLQLYLVVRVAFPAVEQPIVKAATPHYCRARLLFCKVRSAREGGSINSAGAVTPAAAAAARETNNRLRGLGGY